MKFKRLIAVLLSMALIVGMIPTLVFADESQPEPAETSAAQTTESKETEETKESKEKETEATKVAEPSESKETETEEPSESSEKATEETKPAESSPETSEAEESKESDAVKGKMPEETQSVGKKNAKINISGETKLSELVANGLSKDDWIVIEGDTTLVIDTDCEVYKVASNSSSGAGCKFTIQGDHTLTLQDSIECLFDDISMESGKVVIKAKTVLNAFAIECKNLNVSGGMLSVDQDTSSGRVIGVYFEKTINITGGKLYLNLISSSSECGIYSSSGTLKISGGETTIRTNSTTTSMGIYCEKFTVADGKITVDVVADSDAYAIRVGEIGVSGGTLNVSAESNYSNYGEGIYIEKSGLIEGGKITSQGKSSDARYSKGIFLQNPTGEAETLTITGGEVTALGQNEGIGIYSTKASKSFKIGGNAKVTSTSTDGKGIYSMLPVVFEGDADVTIQGKDSSWRYCAVSTTGSITVADTLEVMTPENWKLLTENGSTCIANADTGVIAAKVVIKPARTIISSLYFETDSVPAAGKTNKDCTPVVTVKDTGVKVVSCKWTDASGNSLADDHVFTINEDIWLFVDYQVEDGYKLASDIADETLLNGVKPVTHDTANTTLYAAFKSKYDISGSETEVIGLVDVVYTGNPVSPIITVKYNGIELKSRTDYICSFTNNTNAGTAEMTITGFGDYTGQKKFTFKILKAENTLSVKPKTAKVKYKKLKKKNQTLSVSKVLSFTSGGQGTRSYAKVSGNKKIKINKTTGKVTVKKKLKKGTYKVKIKVKAAGNTNYNPSGWKIVTFRIKVK